MALLELVELALLVGEATVLRKGMAAHGASAGAAAGAAASSVGWDSLSIQLVSCRTFTRFRFTGDAAGNGIRASARASVVNFAVVVVAGAMGADQLGRANGGACGCWLRAAAAGHGDGSATATISRADGAAVAVVPG